LSDTLHHRARVAVLTRHRGDHDTEVLEARRALRESVAIDYIRKLADEAPPFTAEQRLRIAAILCSPAGAGDAT
jgi:hypothetical protein